MQSSNLEKLLEEFQNDFEHVDAITDRVSVMKYRDQPDKTCIVKQFPFERCVESNRQLISAVEAMRALDDQYICKVKGFILPSKRSRLNGAIAMEVGPRTSPRDYLSMESRIYIAQSEEPDCESDFDNSEEETINELSEDEKDEAEGKNLRNNENKYQNAEINKEGMQIVMRIALAIKAIHDAGFVHNNISDETILYDDEKQQPMIVGFEYATSSSSLKKEKRKESVYSDPDANNSSKLVDVYSFGILLYRLIAKSPLNADFDSSTFERTDNYNMDLLPYSLGIGANFVQNF